MEAKKFKIGYLKQVLVSGLALLKIVSGVYASNILTSNPSQTNGSIITCAGEDISLTCSHNNVATAATTWKISSPVNCSTDIIHSPPINADPCGPFSFHDITPAQADIIQLNSTAVATASSEISGSVIECLAGFISSNLDSVDNISLCIIDELPVPVNLSCWQAPDRLLVTWNVTTDGPSYCARDSIIHDVTLVGKANWTFSMSDFKDNRIEISNSSLEPSQNYTVYIRTSLVQGTCDTRESSVTCRNLDDFSPTTEPLATDNQGMNSNTVVPETNSGSPVSAAAVAVPIVLILALVAAVVIGILVFFGCYYKRYGKLPFNLMLPFRKLEDQNSENNSTSHHLKSELQHTHAPDGAEYTCIDKVTKNTELQHTRAPDGAEYTCIDKITKSKDHKAQRDHSSDGSSNDSIEKIKNQDIKSDTDTKKEDSPPPKPRRATKTKDKPEIKNKSESSAPPPSDPNKYEDIDDL